MERIRRPKMEVLDDAALVPPGNLADGSAVHPTHAIAAAQPYYFHKPAKGAAPAGAFAPGDRVQLLASVRGPYSRVADPRGFVAYTASAGLEPLAGPQR